MDLIRITPVAFESLGVRSMSTFVETPDVKILIDPGVALGLRLRLLPHPEEYEALRNSRQILRKYARMADILTVSHYHHDHFTPSFTDTTWLASSQREAENLYRGKTLMVKDVRSSVNVSQRRRGWIFQSFCRKIESQVIVADAREFQYGDTKVRFSTPLPHGEDASEQGWVLATIVELPREKLVHASDIQGPMSDRALRFILDERPTAVIVGGPPSYLSGLRVSEDSIKKGLENLAVIAREIPLVIVDHHLLRDQGSLGTLSELSAVVKSSGHEVMTAAEHLGKPPRLLEANRKELYRDKPPSRSFVKWTELDKEKQRKITPPLERKRTRKSK